MGPVNHFSRLVTRTNRSLNRNENLIWSFPSWIHYFLRVPTHFSFVVSLFIWEGDPRLSSFMWILGSHHYLPLWRLMSTSFDVLSNLCSKMPWVWHFELMFDNVPEVLSTNITRVGLAIYLASLLPMRNSWIGLSHACLL